MKISLPTVKMGRRNADAERLFQHQVEVFCQGVKEVNSSLDFQVSSRGWCYLLEEYGLNKGDFDKAQTLINDCRKSGLLPLDICAEDSTRTAEGIENPDDSDAENYAFEWVDYVRNTLSTFYHPYYFSDFQKCYIEMLVEKIDLKGIFKPVCEEYKIPYANNKGWADINSRAALMLRFKEWESKGKQCVLLYCGDHDPGGLNISDTIRTNLSALSNAVGWSPDNLIIDRFGLNYDFIIANNLTWIENLETGSGKRLDNPKHNDFKKPYVQTYLKQFGARKVEANALVTRVEEGRKLCEDAVLKYINLDGIDNYNEATEDARTLLQEEIANLMK
jgi:hypothetical protein